MSSIKGKYCGGKKAGLVSGKILFGGSRAWSVPWKMVGLDRNGEIIPQRRHNMHEQKSRDEKMKKGMVEEEEQNIMA